jgi:hypothetical protein
MRASVAKLSLSECLTFLVAIGSLAIAALTYRQQQDTSDLQRQIGALTQIAHQSRLQTRFLGNMAAGSRSQTGLLSDQVATMRSELDEASNQTKSLADQAHSGLLMAKSSNQQAEAALSALAVQQKSFSYGFRPQVRLIAEKVEAAAVRDGDISISFLLHTAFKGNIPAVDYGVVAMIFREKNGKFNYSQEILETCNSADRIGHAMGVQLDADEWTISESKAPFDKIEVKLYPGSEDRSANTVHIACASWRSESDGSLHHSITVNLLAEINAVTKARLPISRKNRAIPPINFARYQLPSVNN